MPVLSKMRFGKLLKEHPRYGPLGALYIGGKIRGDIMSPTVRYEDYTFDLNNIDPDEYAKVVAENERKAHRRRQRKSK